MGDAEAEQPIDKQQQPCRCRRERMDVAGAGAVVLHDPGASNHGLLVDIQSCTVRIDNLHHIPPHWKAVLVRLAGCRQFTQLMYGLPGRCRCPKVMCRAASRSDSTSDSRHYE